MYLMVINALNYHNMFELSINANGILCYTGGVTGR